MFDKEKISRQIIELKSLGILFLQKATKLEEELDLFQDSTPPSRGGLSEEEKMKLIAKRNIKCVKKN